MSKLFPCFLLALLGCNSNLSEREKREREEDAEWKIRREQRDSNESALKERGLAAYEAGKALGRFQLVSAPVSTFDEANGHRIKESHQRLFKIDSVTGESWLFCDDFSTSNQIHGWVFLRDLHITFRSDAAENALPDAR